MSVLIDGSRLNCAEVTSVARDKERVELGLDVMERLIASRGVVDAYVRDSRVAYGITTGVGKLCNEVISREQSVELQRNILLSHSCGVGSPLSEEEVRAIMLVRANMFAVGNSGVSPEVVDILVSMLNAGIHPVLPEKGGVGSGGSISIGAHLAMAITGNGEAIVDGQRMPSRKALESKGLKPVVLGPKDALCLLNGTHAMCGIGSLAVHDLWNAVKSAEIAAAMSLEALSGNVGPFEQVISDAKRHPGQRDAARNIRRMLEGSGLYTRAPVRVQDAYSFRCLPQNHGAAREVLSFCQTLLEREMNSASDNPLVFPEEQRIISCGNFHGEIPAMALDFLAMAAVVVANLSERRISRMVDPQSSNLPAFLVHQSGLNSGFMIPQYIAASLVSEMKLLASPVSIDSIPTSGGQEDIVSNGTIAARKAREVVEDLNSIVGIELLSAAQAMDLSGRKDFGKGTWAAYRCVREHIKPLIGDRFMEPDILSATRLVSSGTIVRETERVVGVLD